MDKILSARVDETVIDELNRAAKRRGVTKKQFLEEAIRLHAGAGESGSAADVWSETCGAWRRRESAPTIIRRTRAAFNASMARHQRQNRTGR
jgi:hypothetical protein